MKTKLNKYWKLIGGVGSLCLFSCLSSPTVLHNSTKLNKSFSKSIQNKRLNQNNLTSLNQTNDDSITAKQVFGESSGATGTLYYKLDGSNLYFTAGDGSTSLVTPNGAELVFPSTINIDGDKTVVGIDEHAFNTAHCDIKGSIKLPSTLTSLGHDAFFGCAGITSIDLSECKQLATIPYTCFSKCTNLSSINLSGCTSLNWIQDGAFFQCPLTTILTPPSWETPEGALVSKHFSNGKMICAKDNTNIPVGNLAYGEIILDSVDVIATNSFNGCVGVTSVDFSNCTNLSGIEGDAFSDCINITNVNLANHSLLEYIGGDAFANCSKIQNVDLSGCKKLNKIWYEAFSNCCQLKSVDLFGCDYLNIIQGNAFYDCFNLTSISLPESITEIDASAFGMSDGVVSLLTTITFNWEYPYGMKTLNDNWLMGQSKNTSVSTFYVPEASLDRYNEYVMNTATCPAWWDSETMYFIGFTPTPTPTPTPSNNSNLGLILGLSLGLGIPAIGLSILAISLSNKKHKFWY